MRRPAWHCYSLWLTIVSAGCGAVPPQRGAASPACAVVLAERTGHDPTVVELQRRIQTGKNPAQVLELLGFHYIRRARRAHDDVDYMLAEHAAQCLDERAPGRANALLIRGHALHQRHRFKEAEAIARQLVTRRGFVLDYGLLGDALMEQGRIDEAAAAYQRMIDIKPFYQSYIRAAHLRWLTGDRPGAIDLVRRAIASASPRDPESIAWAYTRLADYELQSGRLREAAAAADAALASLPDYAAALLVRGRIHAAAHRRREAIDDLNHAARLNPEPEYQWVLAEALRAGNEAAQATAIEERLVARGTRSDPRTLALFLATRRRDTAQAIRLAERELAERGDVFTLDAYAWALASAGRYQEAAPVMARALAANTDDARLFVHAAVIASATGRRAEARQWSAKAQRIRFTLLPSELDVLQRAQTAQSHAEEN